jgi:hypothetical protein
MNNPIKNLLGKTFLQEKSNIGTQLENILGINKNNGKGADFGFFEVKSKNINSTSMVTLGGCIQKNIEQYVYNKIKNVIFIEYNKNDYNFTINKITILYNLKYENFINSPLYYENRKRQSTIRLHYKYFLKMYGKYRIEYTI